MKYLKLSCVFLLIFFIFASMNSYAQDFEIEKADKKKYEKKKEKDAVIVVTGTRTKRKLKDVPIRTQVVTKEKIERSGAKNMYEILEKGLIPGVTVNNSCTNCNFSEIRMQGLESGYTLMLFDGLPVFSALAGVYGLRQINPVNIERIEVVKGASSALYGSQALGGVINIITKEPDPDHPILSASYTYGTWGSPKEDAYDIDATAGIRKGNIAFILTGSKHHNDYVNANGDKYTDQVEQDNLYLSGKTHIYFADDAHRITVQGKAMKAFRRGGYTGHVLIGVDLDEDGVPDIDWPFKHAIDNYIDGDSEHINTMRWEYGIGYRGVFNPGNSVEVNWVQSRHERGATNAARQFNSEEDANLIDLIYSHPIKKITTITAGVSHKEEVLHQVINYMEDRDKKIRSIGSFIQDELKIKKVLDIVAGVRYDNVYDSTIKEDWAITPRLGVRYGPLKFLNIRASYGYGFKVPQMFSEELHLCSAAPKVYTPKGLHSEKSRSINAGVELLTKKITADANFFRTDISSKIKLIFDNTLIPPYDAYYRNAGGANTQGVEANVTVKIIKPLSLNGSFTYTRAMYSRKTLLPDQPGYSRSKHMLRIPDITAGMGLAFDHKKSGIKASVDGRYTGMQYVQREMVIDGLSWISRRGRYIILDARISKDFHYLGWTQSIFVGMNNITNYKQARLYNALEEESAACIWAPTTGRYLYGGAKISL